MMPLWTLKGIKNKQINKQTKKHLELLNLHATDKTHYLLHIKYKKCSLSKTTLEKQYISKFSAFTRLHFSTNILLITTKY